MKGTKTYINSEEVGYQEQMTKIYPTEDQIQIALIDWMKINKIPVIAIQNEGKRSYSYSRLLKKKGQRKGASDLFIPVPNIIGHGLFVELKAINPLTGNYRKPTSEQLVFIEDMIKLGYSAHVANGFDEALEIIRNYLSHCDKIKLKSFQF